MKIQVMSDLHLEFGFTKGDDFISHLDPEGIDVLVLAGDIVTKSSLIPSLNEICKRYENANVLWVHGNHEYYTSSKEKIYDLSIKAMNENKNLTWLNNNIVEINGKRFLGTPLWFRNSPNCSLRKYGMNDFTMIDNFENWVYEENEKSIKFLEENIQSGDIVITHYLPTEESVHQLFKNDSLNCFFLCDMYEPIIEKGPSHWIHGHTHSSCDYKVQTNLNTECRVICNPRGYWPRMLNQQFDNRLIIEV